MFRRVFFLLYLISVGSAFAAEDFDLREISREEETTAILKNGSQIKGRIIEENDDELVFYIQYLERKVTLRKEDISIIKVREKIIREPYAPERKYRITNMSKWNSSRFSFYTSGSLTAGDLNDALPAGFRVGLAYDQGLDQMFSNRQWYIPGLRVDLAYIQWNTDDRAMLGGNVMAGPVWFARFWNPNTHQGQIMWTLLAGASFVSMQSTSFDDTASKFSGGFGLGYEYSLQDISLFMQYRLDYINDPDVFFLGNGLSLGITYKI